MFFALFVTAITILTDTWGSIRSCLPMHIKHGLGIMGSDSQKWAKLKEFFGGKKLLFCGKCLWWISQLCIVGEKNSTNYIKHNLPFVVLLFTLLSDECFLPSPAWLLCFVDSAGWKNYWRWAWEWIHVHTIQTFNLLLSLAYEIAVCPLSLWNHLTDFH